MKAVAASVKYVSNPQNAVGKPNSLAQRLDKTTSQLLPTAQPLTELPVHSVHERYEASAIPKTLRTRSGRLGPDRKSGPTTGSFFDCLLAFAFLPTARHS